MSISPPGDIILDAINAADPARVHAAVEKLRAMEQGAIFDNEIKSVNAGHVGRRALANDLRHTEIGDQRRLRAQAAPDPTVALGRFVLQKAIEQTMPYNSAWFGGGSAGSVWKSAFAEKLADAIAPRIFTGRSNAPATKPEQSI